MPLDTLVLTSLAYVAGAYLTLAGIKYILMLGSFSAALGTYYRISHRTGATISKSELGLMILAINLYICLAGCVQALRREGLRFFVAYNNFGVMRDIVRNFKGVEE